MNLTATCMMRGSLDRLEMVPNVAAEVSGIYANHSGRPFKSEPEQQQRRHGHDGAAQSATASGFAIGRSVFWDPSAAFLSGTKTAEEASAAICGNYLQLVDAWERRSEVRS